MEVLGGRLDLALEELGIVATKKYEKKTWVDDKLQVWEMSDEEFEKLNAVTEDEWKDGVWGWWRAGGESNVDGPIRRYKLNGHYIRAWDYLDREQEKEEARLLKEEYLPRSRTYCGLLDYLEDEIGATVEGNICIISNDLAKMNGLTLAQLFEKYEKGKE